MCTKFGFVGGLITRPDRDLVSCFVGSAGLSLAVSSVDFLYNSFSCLLAGDVRSMVQGVSFEVLAETAGGSTAVGS